MILYNDSIESTIPEFLSDTYKIVKLNHLKIILISTLSLLGFGCVHSHHNRADHVHKPEQSLQQSAVCCESFKQLGFKKLPANYKATLYLNSDDPVYSFDTGKSYVESILLPEHNGVTLLKIDSLVSRHSVTGIPTAVFPVVTLLDNNYQPVATLDNLEFTYRNNLLGWRRIRVVITIDNNYSDARYAIIHTSNEKLTESLSTRRPIAIIKEDDFDSMLYANPRKSRKRIKFANNGVFEIVAYPLN